MSKPVQDPNKVVESLRNLRNELREKAEHDITAREILYKVNSCLYDRYPHTYEGRK